LVEVVYDFLIEAIQAVCELRELFDGLFKPIVSNVIGCQFGSQTQMIADILLEKVGLAAQ